MRQEAAEKKKEQYKHSIGMNLCMGSPDSPSKRGKRQSVIEDYSMYDEP